MNVKKKGSYFAGIFLGVRENKPDGSVLCGSAQKPPLISETTLFLKNIKPLRIMVNKDRIRDTTYRGVAQSGLARLHGVQEVPFVEIYVLLSSENHIDKRTFLYDSRKECSLA